MTSRAVALLLIIGAPGCSPAPVSSGRATAIAVASGDHQTASPGATVGVPPAVRVTDIDGAPVSGVGVSFAVGAGGGTYTGRVRTTNASGIAVAGSWMLGVAGANTLEASVEGLSGSPVTITATAAPLNLRMQSIVAGAYHTCAVGQIPVAYCWGYGGFGALGDGFREDRFTPVRVAGGLSFLSLSAGEEHTCGVVGGGLAYCWGAGADGRLGNGTTDDQFAPMAVSAGSLNVGAISAGFSHTCAIASGTAYCWGANDHGQLGVGSNTRSLVPLQVSGPLLNGGITAGRYHSCATTVQPGSRPPPPPPPVIAFCWGDNSAGQLGDGTNGERDVATSVGGGIPFPGGIVAAGFLSCGLKANPSIAFCWGSNRSGEIGVGLAADTMPHPQPAQIGNGLALQGLVAGDSHACALASVDGSAYCWGDNYAGQLGDGSTTSRNTPTAVLGGLKFTSLAAGGRHTCGLTGAGTIYCWGDNAFGELGDGTTTRRLVPTPVIGP